MLTDEEKRILLAKQAFCRASCGAAGRLLQRLSSRTACFGKNSVIWGHGRADRPCGDRAVRARGGVAVHAGWTGKPFRGTRGRRTVWGCFDVGPDGWQPGRASHGKAVQDPVSIAGRTAPLLRGGWRKRLHTAAVQSAGGDLGEILGITAPYPPPVHSGRADQGWKRICGRRREKPARSSAPE